MKARTNTILWFGRASLADGRDPRPAAEAIRTFTKVYPYRPGSVGTPLRLPGRRGQAHSDQASATDGVPRGQRLYSPLEPFFDKSWRPSETELVP